MNSLLGSKNLFFRRFFKVSLVFVFLLLSLFPLHLHAQSEKRPDIFIAPLVETIGYSREGIAFGGGLIIGAGDDGFAIGLKLLYATDSESSNTLELNFFIRYYLLSPDDHSGLFLQLNGGPVVFNYEEAAGIPSETSNISFGFTVGWRFPFGEHLFVEPAIRCGYPYILGAGVSAGFRL